MSDFNILKDMTIREVFYEFIMRSLLKQTCQDVHLPKQSPMILCYVSIIPKSHPE